MRRFIDIVKPLKEEALQNAKHGHGLEVWQNDDVALSGGIRSGSSPAGYTRCLYVLVDMKEFQKAGDQAASEIGKVEVWRSNEGIEGLVNIVIDKNKRRGGLGVTVIRSLIDTWKDHFVVSDIKKVALNFWKAAGCRFFTAHGQEMSITQARAYKYLINGVIFKAGSNTPVLDLVSFHEKPKIVTEAKPVQPVKPVKPLRPGDPRHNAQNTTAPVAKPGSQQQPQMAQTPVQNNPDMLAHKLPNGQPNNRAAPLQVDPDQMDPNAVDPNHPDAIDPNDAEIDPETLELAKDIENGITAGQKAQQYLKRQGVIEGVEGAFPSPTTITNQLDKEAQKYHISRDDNNNAGRYKKRPFYCGSADLYNGQIIELHTHGYATNAYDGAFDLDTVDRYRDGDAVLFYMLPDGTMNIQFHGEDSGGPLRIKLERMIRAQLD